MGSFPLLVTATINNERGKFKYDFLRLKKGGKWEASRFSLLLPVKYERTGEVQM